VSQDSSPHQQALLIGHNGCLLFQMVLHQHLYLHYETAWKVPGELRVERVARIMPSDEALRVLGMLVEGWVRLSNVT
jgi:hypothetical protein